jgi:hypothetical protein
MNCGTNDSGIHFFEELSYNLWVTFVKKNTTDPEATLFGY